MARLRRSVGRCDVEVEVGVGGLCSGGDGGDVGECLRVRAKICGVQVARGFTEAEATVAKWHASLLDSCGVEVFVVVEVENFRERLEHLLVECHGSGANNVGRGDAGDVVHARGHAHAQYVQGMLGVEGGVLQRVEEGLMLLGEFLAVRFLFLHIITDHSTKQLHRAAHNFDTDLTALFDKLALWFAGAVWPQHAAFG